MISHFDTDFVDFVTDMNNSLHRLKVVFDFKEQIDVKRRKAMKKLKRAFFSLNEDKIKDILQNELLIYMNPAKDAEWLFHHKAFKESIPRAYRTAIDVLDHHIGRLNTYLSRLPNTDELVEAQNLVNVYIQMRELCAKKMLPATLKQYEILNNFYQTLSLHQYRELWQYYELEHKAQEEIYSFGKIALRRALKRKRFFYNKGKRYGELKADHPMKFALLEMTFAIVCVFTGMFVVKQGILYFVSIGINYMSDGISVLTPLVEMVRSKPA